MKLTGVYFGILQTFTCRNEKPSMENKDCVHCGWLEQCKKEVISFPCDTVEMMVTLNGCDKVSHDGEHCSCKHREEAMQK